MRTLLVFMILFTLMFLTACGPTQSDIPLTNEEFWKGTNALSFDFVKENPPKTVYEDMFFNVALEMENTGAHLLNGYVTLSVEDDYMCLVDEAGECATFDGKAQYSAQLRSDVMALYDQIEDYKTTLATVDPDEVNEVRRLKDLIYELRTQVENLLDASPVQNEDKTRWFSLEGQSIFNHEGGSDVLDYKAKSKTAGVLSEQHDVEIVATSCYEYTTVWNQEVCIDTDINKMNIFEGACEATDIGLNSQGAPVAITKIESRMLPTGTGYIRPMFTIYLSNKGNGNVINADKILHACTSTGLKTKDYNLVFLKQFTLSNDELLYDFNGLDPQKYTEIDPTGDGDPISCYPNPIRLDNDQDDKITCIVNKDIEWDMFSLEQAPYTTMISMQFDYGYTLSESTLFTIEKI